MEAHENCQHTATDDMLAEISGEEWVIEMADGSTSAPGASKALTLGSADSLPEKASRQAEELANLTPAERIAKLFDAMPGQKAVLFGIVDYCREPRSPEALDSFTAELQKTNVSVFTPVLLRQHLESAGALAYEEPDGDAATAQDAGGAAGDAAGGAAAGEAADGGFGAEGGTDAAAGIG
ncbi:MAG: hypothetical protein LBG81_02415, partial [Coriobacteriaceae bacterium]|nr:hypothetical protein [Coriobacteriaceae bacterium]